jgi:hypothetical protein
LSNSGFDYILIEDENPLQNHFTNLIFENAVYIPYFILKLADNLIKKFYPNFENNCCGNCKKLDANSSP